MITLTPLGQSGFRFKYGGTVIFVDPYLSDSVAERFGKHLARQVPAPFAPEDVTDADFVLITHAHEDHTDPATLGPMSRASKQARFLVACESVPILQETGIEASRIDLILEKWTPLTTGISYKAVPAAHTGLDRDAQGNLRFAGFLIRFGDCLIYHAGDTMPHEEIFKALKSEDTIDYAFLPINERNYFRDRAGIIGNLSLREAFQFAIEIGAKRMVPIHWDLFAVNSVFPEEIELLYQKMKPPFALEFCPVGKDYILGKEDA
jgi:L-ascorbate metabolism protein UlaG (beta-lactamase superfamily)